MGHGRIAVIALILLAGCPTSFAAVGAADQLPAMTGLASWYSKESPGIRETTANMEIFDDTELTCAIWDVPFNSIIEVRNLENDKKVSVRVNDRGPAKRLVAEGRIIDLTKAAFEKIANTGKGLIEVEITVIES